MKDITLEDIKNITIENRKQRITEKIVYTEKDGEFELNLYAPVEHFMTAKDDDTFVRNKETGECLGKSGFSFGKMFDDTTHKRLPKVISKPNCLEHFNDGKKPLEEFKKSKYWQRLFDCGEVLFIYLAGSRMINCYDEESDYDVFVVTDGSFIKESENVSYENVKFRGVKIQWWFKNIHDIIPNHTKIYDWLANWGIILFGQLTKDDILYVNPKYQKVVDFIENEHERIEHIGLHQYYECTHEIIDSISETKKVYEFQINKWLYSMCWAADHFSGTPINTANINLIKRMKHRQVPKFIYDEVVDKINILHAYIHNDKKTFDYVKEKEIFKVNLENILKEI